MVGLRIVFLLVLRWISYTEGLEASFSTRNLPVLIQLECDDDETLMIHKVDYDDDCECWLDTDMIFTHCNDRSNCSGRLDENESCDPFIKSECERNVKTLNVEYSCILNSVSLCSPVNNNYFGRRYTIIRLLQGEMTSYEQCICYISGRHTLTFLSHKSLSPEETLYFDISGVEQKLTSTDMQMNEASDETTISLYRARDDFDSRAVMNLHITTALLRDLLSIKCEFRSYPSRPETDQTTTTSTFNRDPADPGTTTTTTTRVTTTNSTANTATDGVTTANDNGLSSGQSSGNGINGGVIGGAVIGGLAIIGVLVAVIVFVVVKKRNACSDKWNKAEKNPVYIDCPSLIPPGSIDCEKAPSKDKQQSNEREDNVYHVYAEIDKSKKIKKPKVDSTENDSSDDDFVYMKNIPEAGNMKKKETEATEAEYSYAEVPNRLQHFTGNGSTEGSVTENGNEAAPSSGKSRPESTTDYTTFSDNLAYVGSDDDETELKIEASPPKPAEREEDEKIHVNEEKTKEKSEEKTEEKSTKKYEEIDQDKDEKLQNEYTYMKDNCVYEELDPEPKEEEKTEVAIIDNKQPETEIENEYTLISENTMYEC